MPKLATGQHRAKLQRDSPKVGRVTEKEVDLTHSSAMNQ